MTGLRVARGGVQKLERIAPDPTCLGKDIGGRFPVGAFGERADIMEHLVPSFQSGPAARHVDREINSFGGFHGGQCLAGPYLACAPADAAAINFSIFSPSPLFR